MEKGLSYPKILIKKEQGDLIPLESIVSGVPENVLGIIRDCLERDKERRPKDVSVVLERLKIPIGHQKTTPPSERPTTVEIGVHSEEELDRESQNQSSKKDEIDTRPMTVSIDDVQGEEKQQKASKESQNQRPTTVLVNLI